MEPVARACDLPDGEALFGSFLADGTDSQRQQLPVLLQLLGPISRRPLLQNVNLQQIDERLVA